eukprot:scaffold70029_cov43-Prasinocladus_malaysianus.AAC.1
MEAKIMYGNVYCLIAWYSGYTGEIAPMAEQTLAVLRDNNLPLIKLFGYPCYVTASIIWLAFSALGGEISQSTAQDIVMNEVPRWMEKAKLKESYLIACMLEAFWEPISSARVGKWTSLIREISRTTRHAPGQALTDITRSGVPCGRRTEPWHYSSHR